MELWGAFLRCEKMNLPEGRQICHIPPTGAYWAIRAFGQCPVRPLFMKYGYCRPLTPKQRPLKSGKFQKLDLLLLNTIKGPQIFVALG